jgi:hypothetical protein
VNTGYEKFYMLFFVLLALSRRHLFINCFPLQRVVVQKMSRATMRDKRRNDRSNSSESGSDDGRGRIDEKLPTVSFGGLVMVNLRDPAKPIEIPKAVSAPQAQVIQDKGAAPVVTSSTQDYLNLALRQMQSGKPEPEQQKFTVQLLDAQNVHAKPTLINAPLLDVRMSTITPPAAPTDDGRQNKPFLELGGLFSSGFDWTSAQTNPMSDDWGEDLAAKVASFGMELVSSLDKDDVAIAPPQAAPQPQGQDIKVEAGPAPGQQAAAQANADSKTKSTLRSTAAEFVPSTKGDTPAAPPPAAAPPAPQAPRQQNFTFIHSIGAYAAVIPRRPQPQQYVIRAQPGQNVQQVIEQLMREHGVGAHQFVIQQGPPPPQAHQ